MLIETIGQKYAESLVKKKEFFKQEGEKHLEQLDTKIETLAKLGNLARD